jgi:aminoglycoside phosphotransferase (APT) family kinase protein
VIHADARWDNIVIEDKATESPVLVDWELSGPGDPAWDVGTILAQPLSAWLGSIPIAGEVDPTRLVELAERPLESTWPWVRAFAKGYAEEAGLPPGERQELMVNAVSLAGIWLVQAAFELAQESAEPTGRALLHLQLGENVMTRPEAAGVDLLGLPWR